MAFTDFDVEVQDNNESEQESFSGSITTSGSPITITPTSTRTIQFFHLEVPGTRDPDNPNAIDDAIKFSIDGGTIYITLMSGESITLPGGSNVSNIKLDSNANGTYYKLIVWS